jgi:hypothetical protein
MGRPPSVRVHLAHFELLEDEVAGRERFEGAGETSADHVAARRPRHPEEIWGIRKLRAVEHHLVDPDDVPLEVLDLGCVEVQAVDGADRVDHEVVGAGEPLAVVVNSHGQVLDLSGLQSLYGLLHLGRDDQERVRVPNDRREPPAFLRSPPGRCVGSNRPDPCLRSHRS